MPPDTPPKKRASPDQYGWAGGCIGVVVGAVLLTVERIVWETDRDLVLFMSLPFWALVGAFAGGIVGALIGLAIRAIGRKTLGGEPRG